MRFGIDGVEHYVDLGHVAHHLQAWYDTHKFALDNVQLQNGKKLDFGRKSLMRLGMKAFFVGFAIPLVADMYASRGLVMPPHAKHEDLIDYIVRQLLEFSAIIEKDVHFYAAATVDTSNVRIIKAVSPVKPIAIGDDGLPYFIPDVRKSTSEGQQDTGRGTLVRVGENGDGQDSFNTRDNREESITTTIP